MDPGALGQTLEDQEARELNLVTALERAQSTLGPLSPPEEVASTHPEFVDAVTGFADLAGQLAARAEALETQEDLYDLANDPVIGVASYNLVEAEAVAACGALQAVADAGSIAVDLECGSLAGE